MGRLARDAKSRITFVYGPDGATLTLSDLPAPETRRWVSRRKAQVVAAVLGGLLSPDEACERYALSIEEYLGWQRAMEQHGVPGLRATHVQEFRGREEHRATH
jgi:hypothetical protein